MRKIKNRNKLKKDLKSESGNSEHDYMKHPKNTNGDDNNNNNNNDTYDSKIRDKISDIRMILSRLGNILTKKDKKKIKKELFKKENKKNLSDMEKEKNYDNLVKLVRTLDKKRKIQIS